jgi:hypothetical protein
MTDEQTAYNGLNDEFSKHDVVNHCRKEYVRGGSIHVTNIENFWSLLKRGNFGITNYVSPEYFSHSCNEFQFRNNSREDEDKECFEIMFVHYEENLSYKNLINPKG